MKLDREMCTQAEEYAKILADRGIQEDLKHSPMSKRTEQGENLFAGCNSNIDGADITRIW